MSFHNAGTPLHFSNQGVRDRFKHYLSFASLEDDNLLNLEMPIILSLAGINQTGHFPFWYSYHPFPYGQQHFMSRQLFEALLDPYYRHLLDFYRRLTDAGKVAVCIMPPGMRSNLHNGGDLFMMLRDYVTEALTGCGVLVADATELTCDAHGILRQEYWVENPEDFFHANTVWGKIVAVECCRALNL